MDWRKVVRGIREIGMTASISTESVRELPETRDESGAEWFCRQSRWATMASVEPAGHSVRSILGGRDADPLPLDLEAHSTGPRKEWWDSEMRWRIRFAARLSVRRDFPHSRRPLLGFRGQM